MKLVISFFLATLACALAGVKLHPLSNEFIADVNSRKSTWKSGRNFDINTRISYLHSLAGTIKTNLTGLLQTTIHDISEITIPESFDAREQWPDCSIIGEIRDQAACGSCWAVAAVEAMSDRICIASNGKTQVSVSAEDLNDCCKECGGGCRGGIPYYAWSFWVKFGIVTGGGYGTTTGCKAYSLEPCAHSVSSEKPACVIDGLTPACVAQCDADSSLTFEDSLTYGKSVYSVDNDVKQIQAEILTNGPVEAAFSVYEDFYTYKSGVYQYVSGEHVGGHAVKIIGWGVEDDVPYWLIANSWNTDWGDNGYFKFLRGSNHLGMEEGIVAGLPKL